MAKKGPSRAKVLAKGVGKGLLGTTVSLGVAIIFPRVLPLLGAAAVSIPRILRKKNVKLDSRAALILVPAGQMIQVPLATLAVVRLLLPVLAPSMWRGLRYWRRLTPILYGYWRTHKESEMHKRDREFYLAEEVWRDQHRYASEAIYEMLVDLKGFYLKLGQLLASKADLLPVLYTKSLSRLLDQMPPIPFSKIIRIIESDLGLDLDDIFDWIDEEAIASATVAQVHRAKLLDTGEDVAVKVQHPGVRRMMVSDLANVRFLSELLIRMGVDVGFDQVTIIEQYQECVPGEFDFEREAWMMTRASSTITSVLGSLGGVRVPRPVIELCSERVLIMEFLEGVPLLEGALSLPKEHRTAIMANLIRALGAMMFLDGAFHTDPHPGNLLLLTDRRTVGLLDWGQLKELDDESQVLLARLTLALAAKDHEAILFFLKEAGLELRNCTDAFLEKSGYILFDTRADFAEAFMSPTDPTAKEFRETKVDQMPPELFMVVRVVFILRGILASLAVDLSASQLWVDYAIRCLESNGYDQDIYSYMNSVLIQRGELPLPHRHLNYRDSTIHPGLAEAPVGSVYSGNEFYESTAAAEDRDSKAAGQRRNSFASSLIYWAGEQGDAGEGPENASSSRRLSLEDELAAEYGNVAGPGHYSDAAAAAAEAEALTFELHEPQPGQGGYDAGAAGPYEPLWEAAADRGVPAGSPRVSGCHAAPRGLSPMASPAGRPLKSPSPPAHLLAPVQQAPSSVRGSSGVRSPAHSQRSQVLGPVSVVPPSQPAWDSRAPSPSPRPPGATPLSPMGNSRFPSDAGLAPAPEMDLAPLVPLANGGPYPMEQPAPVSQPAPAASVGVPSRSASRRDADLAPPPAVPSAASSRRGFEVGSGGLPVNSDGSSRPASSAAASRSASRRDADLAPPATAEEVKRSSLRPRQPSEARAAEPVAEPQAPVSEAAKPGSRRGDLSPPPPVSASSSYGAPSTGQGPDSSPAQAAPAAPPEPAAAPSQNASRRGDGLAAAPAAPAEPATNAPQADSSRGSTPAAATAPPRAPVSAHPSSSAWSSAAGSRRELDLLPANKSSSSRRSTDVRDDPDSSADYYAATHGYQVKSRTLQRPKVEKKASFMVPLEERIRQATLSRGNSGVAKTFDIGAMLGLDSTAEEELVQRANEAKDAEMNELGVTRSANSLTAIKIASVGGGAVGSPAGSTRNVSPHLGGLGGPCSDVSSPRMSAVGPSLPSSAASSPHTGALAGGLAPSQFALQPQAGAQQTAGVSSPRAAPQLSPPQTMVYEPTPVTFPAPTPLTRTSPTHAAAPQPAPPPPMPLAPAGPVYQPPASQVYAPPPPPSHAVQLSRLGRRSLQSAAWDLDASAEEIGPAWTAETAIPANRFGAQMVVTPGMNGPVYYQYSNGGPPPAYSAPPPPARAPSGPMGYGLGPSDGGIPPHVAALAEAMHAAADSSSDDDKELRVSKPKRINSIGQRAFRAKPEHEKKSLVREAVQAKPKDGKQWVPRPESLAASLAASLSGSAASSGVSTPTGAGARRVSLDEQARRIAGLPPVSTLVTAPPAALHTHQHTYGQPVYMPQAPPPQQQDPNYRRPTSPVPRPMPPPQQGRISSPPPPMPQSPPPPVPQSPVYAPLPAPVYAPAPAPAPAPAALPSPTLAPIPEALTPVELPDPSIAEGPFSPVGTLPGMASNVEAIHSMVGSRITSPALVPSDPNKAASSRVSSPVPAPLPVPIEPAASDPTGGANGPGPAVQSPSADAAGPFPGFSPTRPKPDQTPAPSPPPGGRPASGEVDPVARLLSDPSKLRTGPGGSPDPRALAVLHAELVRLRSMASGGGSGRNSPGLNSPPPPQPQLLTSASTNSPGTALYGAYGSNGPTSPPPLQYSQSLYSASQSYSPRTNLYAGPQSPSALPQAQAPYGQAPDPYSYGGPAGQAAAPYGMPPPPQQQQQQRLSYDSPRQPQYGAPAQAPYGVPPGPNYGAPPGSQVYAPYRPGLGSSSMR